VPSPASFARYEPDDSATAKPAPLGDCLRLKTIRLSLDAIAAWWVAKGDPIKAPKDGNAFWAVVITF
jgi:hypothetical protein